jgi:hypothetical protein
VFMQQNPGFLVLYTFIKDALLSKVGVVKVWWECRALEERETYLDLDDAAFASIVADPDIEIIEHTARDAAPSVPPTGSADGVEAPPPAPDAAPPKLHDVTISVTRQHECARVEPVPPEEFGISRHARTLRDADYCFHDVAKSEAALIAEGYDRAQVEKLPSCIVAHTIEEQARDTVNESTLRQGEDNLDSSNRLIRVTEHYIRMDYEQDDAIGEDGRERPGLGEDGRERPGLGEDGRKRPGAPALYRVVTGGEQGEVLTRDGEPAVIREDVIPFAAMTPVIITHRFFGRSIADLVMDIQRIKTALLRALLDNAYLANNPRTEVAESHATETTLDDLLVSRPGGIVRTRMPGGLSVIQHPDVGGHVFPLLQYQDAAREWRTGVSRQGQGVDPNALQNQVATIANQMFNAAQAKVKLIARIFAETGIRDLFTLLHAVIRKHGARAPTVRLRNQWVAVDPRDWQRRNDMTINVGLGTGTKSEQLAHLTALIGLQKEALAAGKANLVSDHNLYNAAKEFTRLVGLKNVDAYFSDPRSQPAPQPPPDPAVARIREQAAIEQAQAEADIATQQRKTEAEMALAQQRFELERELKLLDARIKTEQHRQQMTMNAVKAAAVPAPAASGEHGEAAAGVPAEHPHTALIAGMMEALHRLGAPKRARKMADGTWITEHV